jgi:alpha-tubulin suppressor-like RCC1 family protein
VGSKVPVQVTGLSGVTAISAGEFDTMYALRRDTTVWDWGNGGNDQLGNGTWEQATTPVEVCDVGQRPPCLRPLAGIRMLSGGNQHVLALRASDGAVLAWGLNSSGELGDGSTTDRKVPVQVPGIMGATAISAGGRFSIAVW